MAIEDAGTENTSVTETVTTTNEDTTTTDGGGYK